MIESIAGEDIKAGDVVYIDQQTGKVMMFRSSHNDVPGAVALRNIAKDELVSPDGEHPALSQRGTVHRMSPPALPRKRADDDSAEAR